jgi:hypothetical protein
MAVRAKMNIEQAWESLFDTLNIVDKVNTDGVYRISSKTINNVKEARLMAKFDQSSQLPQIFQKNKLSILPVTRGEYIIGRFSTHKRVIYPASKPTPVEVPDLQTLDYTNLYSEASTLLFAYNSGIIKDIMGNSNVAFTVNGRMSSGSFEYYIGNSLNPRYTSRVLVQNAQVEIDAGYETADTFCIFEAKNIAAEELLIRQLYYPYRLWAAKINKPIIPVFFVFSNDIFHAFIYEFEDLQNYNSINLLAHKSYTFADEDITLNEAIGLWRTISHLIEPRVTFPQADSFERVVDLMSVLAEGGLTRDEVTLKYEFDARQTNYYISACEYLGFIERDKNAEGERIYQLSSEAHNIMSLRHKPKSLALMRKVLTCPVFHKVFGLTIQIGELPNKRTICEIMSNSDLSINHTTIERRASTVRGWLDWILRMVVSD